MAITLNPVSEVPQAPKTIEGLPYAIEVLFLSDKEYRDCIDTCTRIYKLINTRNEILFYRINALVKKIIGGINFRSITFEKFNFKEITLPSSLESFKEDVKNILSVSENINHVGERENVFGVSYQKTTKERKEHLNKVQSELNLLVQAFELGRENAAQNRNILSKLTAIPEWIIQRNRERFNCRFIVDLV